MMIRSPLVLAPGLDSQMSAGDHAVALVALLYLPVAITGLLLALEAGGRAGVPAAVRLRDTLVDTPPAVRMAALGMAMSATIHLALASSHWSEDHVRAVLFTLEGAALTVVAIFAVTLRIPAWRGAAVALLSAGIVAYAGYVAAGVEQLDPIGIGTKLVEVAVIGLVLVDFIHHVRPGEGWLRQLAFPKANGGFLR
jgi:hypothetical protein